jgi:hypothetical protein
MNIFIPKLLDGRDIASQTVSELSAINAPTRGLWVSFAMIYILLFAAFGLGVWQSAGKNRSLRTVAYLVGIYVMVNFYWPPMHLRGNVFTLTDTLHIVWATITLTLMMLIMNFGAAALGEPFRIYTILTFLVFIVSGALIGVESPGIPKNLPTPGIGIWERINIGAFMLWGVLFSVTLLQKEKSTRRCNLSQGNYIRYLFPLPGKHL